MKREILKLAQEHPEFRGHLLPLIQGRKKTADISKLHNALWEQWKDGQKDAPDDALILESKMQSAIEDMRRGAELARETTTTLVTHVNQNRLTEIKQLTRSLGIALNTCYYCMGYLAKAAEDQDVKAEWDIRV